MKGVYVHSMDCQDDNCQEDCGGGVMWPSFEEAVAISTAPDGSFPVPGWSMSAEELRKLTGITVGQEINPATKFMDVAELEKFYGVIE